MSWSRFRDLPGWVQALAWVLFTPGPLIFLTLTRRGLSRAAWACVTAVVLLVWVSAAGGAFGGQDRTEREAGPGSTSTVAWTSTSTAEAATTTAPSTTTTSAPPVASTTAPPTTQPAPATTAPPASGDATAILAGLRVAPEGPRDGYSRDLFRHWVDADGDRCDTREEVLIAESTSPAQVDPFGCKVVAGDWFSVYDGHTFEDPSELDIDHVVPLGESWDSGAAGWDAARREAFANDLDHPEALIAVSAGSNRSKGDDDPAEWKPPRREAWCQFAHDWASTKIAWDLTADQAEVDALRSMLTGC